jgi:hypothetical protein
MPNTTGQCSLGPSSLRCRNFGGLRVILTDFAGFRQRLSLSSSTVARRRVESDVSVGISATACVYARFPSQSCCHGSAVFALRAGIQGF